MGIEAQVKLAKIGTIMLTVGDLARAIAFYRDVLGVPLRFATEEFAFLDGGGVTLGLRRAAGLAPASGEVRAEVVFEVEDVDEAWRSLTARGVSFRIEPRQATADRYVADFRDPDGNAITIFGPRAG
jgi:lactoylglutathione lyase